MSRPPKLSSSFVAFYKALAVRYRPNTLSDIVGHETVVKTLSNAIESNRVHHAFLFTGTRGVGKTTLARIIALSLNCLEYSAPTMNPCLKCDSCVQIMNGSQPDVMEFDAASRTGVDAIREVIESAAYAPIMSRYKIYIIDEVHMLSKGAFNALLKTVEEPQEKVKFIFATTELKKVPITIMSRCQKFSLRELNAQDLAKYLGVVAEKESFTFEPLAMDLIAKFASGSARDCLSLLDQVMSLCGEDKAITLEKVKQSLNVPELLNIMLLFDAILERDLKKALEVSYDILSTTGDVEFIISALAEIASSLMLRLANVAGLDEEREKLFMRRKDSINIPMLIRTIDLLNASLKDFSIFDSKGAMEMLCVRLIYSSLLPTPSEIIEMISKSSEDN